eukprot:364515-Chlamydomonas_euryale.AAC.1
MQPIAYNTQPPQAEFEAEQESMKALSYLSEEQAQRYRDRQSISFMAGAAVPWPPVHQLHVSAERPKQCFESTSGKRGGWWGTNEHTTAAHAAENVRKEETEKRKAARLRPTVEPTDRSSGCLAGPHRKPTLFDHSTPPTHIPGTQSRLAMTQPCSVIRRQKRRG